MGWSQPSINLLQQLSRGCGGKEPWVCITSSTLHCRGKNVRSKKIGQTNQKMIHFVPNMYVSGKISALRPGTQTVMIFGATKKSENYLKQRDFRICGFLRFFGVFFFFRVFFCGVAGFIPSRLMRCKHFLAFVSPNKKTCNIMQSKP